MRERFEGANRPQLIAAIRRQEFAAGSAEIAEALASVGSLVTVAVGEDLIKQHGEDTDLFLILVGEVAIIVNQGDTRLRRKAGQHVGEMAAIEPSLPRSATCRVVEPVVALKIASSDFLTVGERFGQVWLPIAKELSRRLYQRNTTLRLANEAVKLFIMSSSEAKSVANALSAGLKPDIDGKVWDRGVFFAGGYPLEALEREVAHSDFAVAIAEADDILESKGVRRPTLRDNVLFELGLFMGRLTRFRAVLVFPKWKDIKFPSDLDGLTLIGYDDGSAADLAQRLVPVCDQIRELVKREGVRTFTVG
jgi:CRP/FNR family cyclic AMP-dependent transcriptional regulator